MIFEISKVEVSVISEPNLIIVLLYIVLKKIRTNPASHGWQSDIALENHALRSQTTDESVIR